MNNSVSNRFYSQKGLTKNLLNFPGRFWGLYKVTNGVKTISIIGNANTNNVKLGFWGMVVRAESDARYKFWYRTNKTGTGSKLLDWGVDYGFIDDERRYKGLKPKFSARVKRENWKGKYVLVVRDVKGRIQSWGSWSSKDIL